MNRAKLFAYSSMAVGILGVGLWIRNLHAASQHREERLDRRIAELEARVENEREAQPQAIPVVPEAARYLPAAAGAVAPSAAAPAASASDPPAPAASHGTSEQDLQTTYETHFESEPVEPNWSRQARAQYLPPIQKFLPAASHLESLECHSSFCRLRVTHDSVAESNTFLASLFMLDHHGPLVQTSGGFRTFPPAKTPDGKYFYEIYIAGQGVSSNLSPEPGDPTEDSQL